MGLTRLPARGNGATLERILEAADACFAHQGAGRVTLGQVARAAGFSRGVIYRYFANRRELAVAVALRQAQRRHRQAADIVRAQKSILDGVVEGLVFLAGQTPHHGDLNHDDQATAIRQAAAELWSPVLTEAARRGETRDDLDVDAAALWLALMELLPASLDPARVSESARRARLTRFLVPCLRSPDVPTGNIRSAGDALPVPGPSAASLAGGAAAEGYRSSKEPETSGRPAGWRHRRDRPGG